MSESREWWLDIVDTCDSSGDVYTSPRYDDLIHVIERSAYDKLQAENHKLRDALAFYADKRNWGEPTKDMRDWYLIESKDRGQRARETLKGIE